MNRYFVRTAAISRRYATRATAEELADPRYSRWSDWRYEARLMKMGLALAVLTSLGGMGYWYKEMHRYPEERTRLSEAEEKEIYGPAIGRNRINTPMVTKYVRDDITAEKLKL